MIDTFHNHVALVDVRMPPTHTDEGLRAAREIRSRYPGTAVLVLSQRLEPEIAAVAGAKASARYVRPPFRVPTIPVPPLAWYG